MKNYINKSAKRILSLALALVMLAGCLFTANVGVGITVAAETENADPYADWDNVQYWDGTPLTGFWAPETEGEYAGKYLITTAAQLNYACAVAGGSGTSNKSFVIDPTVDAFIMQPKAVVDKLGIAAFVEASSAEETRKLFEETIPDAGFTPVNWINSANATFAGNFDGSGVGIYGIYADGTGTYSSGTAAANGNGNVGFFPSLDGGDKAYSGGTTDDDGLSVSELVIKNCYFKSFRRVGILTGGAWWVNSSGVGVYGFSNVNSCVFANCYALGQNYIGGSDSLYKTTEDFSEMGLLGGDMNHDPMKLSNTLVYGNKTEYDFYESDGNGGYKVTTTSDAFIRLFKGNGSNDKSQYGSIKNCVILDAQVTGLTDGTYCSNVYSNIASDYSTATNIIDAASAKGAHGKYFMSGLDWDDSDSDGLGWWAIENDYPTPFKPSDDYVSVAAKEFEGSGTEADPYLVYCAKQLDTMVSDGGKTSGSPSYYKVADGVEAIYINKAENLDETKAVASSTAYNNWIHGDTAFHGNFDGNGVTIYGMICKPASSSEYVGFVPVLSTAEAAATIKNVNFAGVYMTSYNSAAVVSSQVSSWKETDGTYPTDPSLTSYITNVTVRESYIKAANKGDTSTATSEITNSDGSTTTVEYTVHANATAAGILSTNNVTPDHVTIANCLYDGGSCEMYDGNSTTDRSYAAAGIVSMQTGGNEITVNNCVSIGINAIPMVPEVQYDYSNRYINSQHEFNTVYGNIPAGFDTSKYAECATCYDIDDKTTFAMLDMPLLNWGGAWDLVEYDGRMIPMPKTSHETVDDYSTQLVKQNGGSGMNNVVTNEGYVAGTYGMYKEFLGSGTEDDPYIISNALDLARAIACGGKNQYSKLHYKLSCDIDVGASWLNENTIEGKYVYVPFEGHIDGDGHTIYNLYAVGETASLIPVIVGGASIKNLHIRNSNIVVGSDIESKGAFFGKYQSDGNGTKVTLEGCSFEGAGVEGGVDYLVGNFSASTITNSYAIGSQGTRYYINYPTITSSAAPTLENADFYGEEGVENPVWYKGGMGNCKPQLVNRAKAMTEVDISGYGDNDYDTNDLVSLRQRLLGNPDYANVYGDVSRNGVTNLSDLALLGRQLVGTYNKIADGFWRNAALGNVVIYYGENDNYDFARKLELALEDAFGEDVKKVVVGNVGVSGITYGNKSENGKLYVHKNDIYTDGTNYYKFNEDADGAITYEQITVPAEIAKYKFDGNCQIVVGDISVADSTGKQYKTDLTGEANYNNYKITHEKANSAVWLQGGSFTAVEQATIDFISQSNPDSSYVYTTNGAVALNPNKVAKTVGGNTYYYAWGDEFTGGELELDNWRHAGMHSESSPDNGGKFDNLEVAYADDMAKLYEVTTDDKLKIWRGYYGAGTEAGTWADGQGYQYLGTMEDNIGTNEFNGTVEDNDTYVTAGKIDSLNSVLAKQGYIEFNVKYPSDGNVFACLWMYGVRLGQTNAQISDGLYSKVLKLNNAAAYADGKGAGLVWDGTTNKMDSRYPSTYKYQMPNASYEIDVVELMQSGSSSNMKNTYKTANFTFHKYVDGGVYDDNGTSKVKFIDWDNVFATNSAKHFSVSSRGNMNGYITDYTRDTFLCDTVSENSYDTSMYYEWNGGMKRNDTDKGTIFSGTPYTTTAKDDMMKVGVEWDTTDPDTMLFKFYIDGTVVGTVKENIEYNEDAEFDFWDFGSGGFLETLTQIVSSDASTANQYMYLLIDNTFYTSESGRDTAKILTQESGDTTVMEIDYVRIYQKDGRRDIVTPETEEFNNGNHFGY